MINVHWIPERLRQPLGYRPRETPAVTLGRIKPQLSAAQTPTPTAPIPPREPRRADLDTRAARRGRAPGKGTWLHQVYEALPALRVEALGLAAILARLPGRSQRGAVLAGLRELVHRDLAGVGGAERPCDARTWWRKAGTDVAGRHGPELSRFGRRA